MISLMCLAAATIAGNVAASSTIQSRPDNTSIVDFVSNNFSEFVSQYNAYHEDELLATSLLRSRELTLEDEKTGYYFDFDNGFMVATEDYNILLISNYDPSYEEELFETNGDIYFSGSAFYNEDGEDFLTLLPKRQIHLLQHQLHITPLEMMVLSKIQI